LSSFSHLTAGQIDGGRSRSFGLLHAVASLSRVCLSLNLAHMHVCMRTYFPIMLELFWVVLWDRPDYVSEGPA